MTEDEAKKKWCPFVRIQKIDDTYLRNNRADLLKLGESKNRDAAACVASSCAAWRSIDKTKCSAILRNKSSGLDGRVIPPEKTGYHSSEDLEYISEGYCGLAGEP